MTPPILELFEQYAATSRITHIVDDACTAVQQPCSTRRLASMVEMKNSAHFTEQMESAFAIEANAHRRKHLPGLLRRRPGKQGEILNAGTYSTKRFLVILPR